MIILIFFEVTLGVRYVGPDISADDPASYYDEVKDSSEHSRKIKVEARPFSWKESGQTFIRIETANGLNSLSPNS
jgi:hypothetical protein